MSLATSLAPAAGGTAPRPRQRSASWLIASLLLFGALPLSFGILRLLQLLGLSNLMPPAVAPPLPLVLHIVGALAYAILGAFQFAPSIRRRWPALHRVAGRLSLVGASLVVGSALWLTAIYVTPSPGGLVLAGLRAVVAAAMALSIGLGLRAAIRRDIPRHRRWMIRAYALGLGSATQMLVLMVAEIITGDAPTELNRALLMGLAWTLNLAAAEWHIHRRRSGRV
ncbi:MAG: DUF2306 domain-containing protein [Devosia sp.]